MGYLSATPDISFGYNLPRTTPTRVLGPGRVVVCKSGPAARSSLCMRYGLSPDGLNKPQTSAGRVVVHHRSNFGTRPSVSQH